MPNKSESTERLALDTLRQIADAKRNSLERRLARSTVEFIESLEAERRKPQKRKATEKGKD